MNKIAFLIKLAYTLFGGNGFSVISINYLLRLFIRMETNTKQRIALT